MSFKHFELLEGFNSFFEQHALIKPTPVQSKVIPGLLNKESQIILAQTGTGKTLSYVLPIVQLIKLKELDQGIDQSKGKPMAIIIAPTKELAAQIQNVFKSLSHHVKIRSRMLSGGMGLDKIYALSAQSFDILVGTPNKIKMALSKNNIKLDRLEFLIFDEADTLFEMGFQKDLAPLTTFANQASDVLVSFVSATLPLSVELFINEQLNNRKLVKVSFSNTHKVQAKIETFNIFVGLSEKMDMLDMFLKKTASGRGIVFANQKNQVDDIFKFLLEKNPKLKVISLHGDMPPTDRLKIHKAFQQGKYQVLIATDVAARGIDIPDLGWVFNYGLPRNAEFYLHRCGRTGRMGKSGQVYNLVSDRDAPLIALINQNIKAQTALNLDTIAKDIQDVKNKMKKPASKKVKTKRVKVTKRSSDIKKKKSS